MWTGDSIFLTVVNMSIIPKLIHSCNMIPIRGVFFFFAKTDKLILKFMEMQKAKKNSDNLKKEKS